MNSVLKVAIVGLDGVGKSTFAANCLGFVSTEKGATTHCAIGEDAKVYTLEMTVVHLCDYDICVLMFSYDSALSYNQLDKCYQLYHSTKGTRSSHPPAIVVGNKADCSQVEINKAENWCIERNLPYFNIVSTACIGTYDTLQAVVKLAWDYKRSNILLLSPLEAERKIVSFFEQQNKTTLLRILPILGYTSVSKTQKKVLIVSALKRETIEMGIEVFLSVIGRDYKQLLSQLFSIFGAPNYDALEAKVKATGIQKSLEIMDDQLIQQIARAFKIPVIRQMRETLASEVIAQGVVQFLQLLTEPIILDLMQQLNVNVEKQADGMTDRGKMIERLSLAFLHAKEVMTDDGLVYTPAKPKESLYNSSTAPKVEEPKKKKNRRSSFFFSTDQPVASQPHPASHAEEDHMEVDEILTEDNSTTNDGAPAVLSLDSDDEEPKLKFSRQSQNQDQMKLQPEAQRQNPQEASQNLSEYSRLYEGPKTDEESEESSESVESADKRNNERVKKSDSEYSTGASSDEESESLSQKAATTTDNIEHVNEDERDDRDEDHVESGDAEDIKEGDVEMIDGEAGGEEKALSSADEEYSDVQSDEPGQNPISNKDIPVVIDEEDDSIDETPSSPALEQSEEQPPKSTLFQSHQQQEQMVNIDKSESLPPNTPQLEHTRVQTTTEAQSDISEKQSEQKADTALDTTFYAPPASPSILKEPQIDNSKIADTQYPSIFNFGEALGNTEYEKAKHTQKETTEQKDDFQERKDTAFIAPPVQFDGIPLGSGQNVNISSFQYPTIFDFGANTNEQVDKTEKDNTNSMEFTNESSETDISKETKKVDQYKEHEDATFFAPHVQFEGIPSDSDQVADISSFQYPTIFTFGAVDKAITTQQEQVEQVGIPLNPIDSLQHENTAITPPASSSYTHLSASEASNNDGQQERSSNTAFFTTTTYISTLPTTEHLDISTNSYPAQFVFGAPTEKKEEEEDHKKASMEVEKQEAEERDDTKSEKMNDESNKHVVVQDATFYAPTSYISSLPPVQSADITNVEYPSVFTFGSGENISSDQSRNSMDPARNTGATTLAENSGAFFFGTGISLGTGISFATGISTSPEKTGDNVVMEDETKEERRGTKRERDEKDDTTISDISSELRTPHARKQFQNLERTPASRTRSQRKKLDFGESLNDESKEESREENMEEGEKEDVVEPPRKKLKTQEARERSPSPVRTSTTTASTKSRSKTRSKSRSQSRSQSQSQQDTPSKKLTTLTSKSIPETIEEQEGNEEDDNSPEKQTKRRKKKEAKSITKDMTLAELKQMTVVELRQYSKSNGLPQSSYKEGLVKSIWNHLHKDNVISEEDEQKQE